MRLITSCFFGILFLTGCLSTSDSDPNQPTPEQIENLQNPAGDFFAHGKVLYKYPDGKHSGELSLKLTSSEELKMQIFAPLVGSLIYELRANPEKFLVLDHQEKKFVLDQNVPEVRQIWMGMDITMEEMRWILKGRLPENSTNWQKRMLPTGEIQLLNNANEIRVRLNPEGQIQSLKKSLQGLLEYQVDIPLYQKRFGVAFPRKIKIVDFSETNRWTMVISEIIPPPSNRKTLSFDVPENMEALIVTH